MWWKAPSDLRFEKDLGYVLFKDSSVAETRD